MIGSAGFMAAPQADTRTPEHILDVERLDAERSRLAELQAQIAAPAFARLPPRRQEAVRQEAEGVCTRMHVLRGRIAAHNAFAGNATT